MEISSQRAPRDVNGDEPLERGQRPNARPRRASIFPIVLAPRGTRADAADSADAVTKWPLFACLVFETSRREMSAQTFADALWLLNARFHPLRLRAWTLPDLRQRICS